MRKFDKNSLSKENSHKFAKELLKRIYGGKYKKLKVDDKPDLKNLKQGFGVEVTRAVNGKKLTMLKEFLFGSLKDEELFTYKEKMLQEFEKETFDENKDGMLDVLEVPGAIADEVSVANVYRALSAYFPSWVGYNMAKCGGCIRGCVSLLEKKGGCMEGRFESPLRTEKPFPTTA